MSIKNHKMVENKEFEKCSSARIFLGRLFSRVGFEDGKKKKYFRQHFVSHCTYLPFAFKSI